MDASVAGITWDEFRPQFWLDAAKAGHGKLIAVTGSFLTQAGIELNETTILLLIWSTIAVASFGLFRFYQSIASHQSEPPARTLANLTRSPRRLGIAAMSLFAIVFVGWSLAAPLATAALAPGIVSPDGYRKTVQHLEGALFGRSISVRATWSRLGIH